MRLPALCGLAAVLCAFALAPVPPAAAENWPQWRGPRHDGTSRETGLPIAWSERAGVVWKCPLPAWGNSTPIIWGDRVFLTSNTDDGRLLLLCIDRPSGKIAWTRQVGTGMPQRAAGASGGKKPRGRQVFHKTQNLATPSCVTDGEVVVCHFGNGDLASCDFEGELLWKHNLQEQYGKYTIWWGHANSPVLCGDAVISVCMQDSCEDLGGEPAKSYLVAHHKRTGARLWYTPRPTQAAAEECDSYTTPIFRQTQRGTEMIVMGGLVLDAYDPATGKRLWWLEGLSGNRVITGPVAWRDTVFLTEGMRRDLLAVKPEGLGAQSREVIRWKFDQGTPDSPTPVVWDKLVFVLSDNGVARCLDAETGRLYWKKRVRGAYRASPLAADGRIYLLNMEGLTTVLAASSRYDRMTENQLDDETIASPVASDGRLYIRGRKALYCIGK